MGKYLHLSKTIKEDSKDCWWWEGWQGLLPSCKILDCLSRFRPLYYHDLQLNPGPASSSPWTVFLRLFTTILSWEQLPPPVIHYMMIVINYYNNNNFSPTTLITTRLTQYSRWSKIFSFNFLGHTSCIDANLFHQCEINPAINSIFHYN